MPVTHSSSIEESEIQEKSSPIHYVATHEQAWELIKAHNQFWVCNCGCRENRGKCERSRLDVCLMFSGQAAPSGSGMHAISFDDARRILQEARQKMLVARPFHVPGDPTKVEGICFCCDDCCGYFLDPTEKCEPGNLVEVTDHALCTLCGDCAPVCYFHARRVEDGRMRIYPDRCYGCGLCVDVCLLGAIRMVPR